MYFSFHIKEVAPPTLRDVDDRSAPANVADAADHVHVEAAANAPGDNEDDDDDDDVSAVSP